MSAEETQQLSAARTQPVEVPPTGTTEAEPSRLGFLPWALFVIALGAAVFFFMLWRGEQSDAGRQQEVRRTATSFLEALTTFRASTIERDAEEIRQYATGNFADEVEKFFGQQAQDAIRKAKAESSGEVRSLYIQSLEGEDAVAFAVVAQTIANQAQPDPRVEVLRIEVRLVETTSGWKVAKVDILRSPTDPTAP